MKNNKETKEKELVKKFICIKYAHLETGYSIDYIKKLCNKNTIQMDDILWEWNF